MSGAGPSSQRGLLSLREREFHSEFTGRVWGRTLFTARFTESEREIVSSEFTGRVWGRTLFTARFTESERERVSFRVYRPRLGQDPLHSEVY